MQGTLPCSPGVEVAFDAYFALLAFLSYGKKVALDALMP